MNILQISTRTYPDIGGVATHVYSLAHYLSKKKIKSIILTCRSEYSQKIKQKEVNHYLIIYYLNFQAPPPQANTLKLIIFFMRFFLFGLIKTIKLHRKYKFRMIHSHSPPPSSFIALITSRLFHIPFLYTVHGLDYPFSLFLKMDAKYMDRYSKKMIVVSRSIEKFFKKNYGLNNIQWIPTGVNISQYYHVESKKQKQEIIEKENIDTFLRTDDFIISYIGYMNLHQKVMGMINFLKAFSLFLKTISNMEEKNRIKLLYIGDGKFSFLLKKEIRDLRLTKNVLFLGKRNNIKNILAISDLVGLTSYIEGFPIILLEAMASKIPCIATNTGETKYILGKTGYIVTTGNIDEIHQALENFHSLSEENKNKKKIDSFNRVKNYFDEEKIFGKIFNIIIKYKRI
ncbi:MAG: glycosyltransferase family 4 protein [Promethearchaeota archaeon]